MSVSSEAEPAEPSPLHGTARGGRLVPGFWAVAFAFPRRHVLSQPCQAPSTGLYPRTGRSFNADRDGDLHHLHRGHYATLLAVQAVVWGAGRGGAVVGAVTTMMVAARRGARRVGGAAGSSWSGASSADGGSLGRRNRDRLPDRVADPGRPWRCPQSPAATWRRLWRVGALRMEPVVAGCVAKW